MPENRQKLEGGHKTSPISPLSICVNENFDLKLQGFQVRLYELLVVKFLQLLQLLLLLLLLSLLLPVVAGLTNSVLPTLATNTRVLNCKFSMYRQYV